MGDRDSDCNQRLKERYGALTAYRLVHKKGKRKYTELKQEHRKEKDKKGDTVTETDGKDGTERQMAVLYGHAPTDNLVIG